MKSAEHTQGQMKKKKEREREIVLPKLKKKKKRWRFGRNRVEEACTAKREATDR